MTLKPYKMISKFKERTLGGKLKDNNDLEKKCKEIVQDEEVH